MITAGATSGQGWLWSRDLPIDEFIAYIKAEINHELAPADRHRPPTPPDEGALALRWMF